MTQLTFLHSEHVQESRDFLALWGATGAVISDHGACVDNTYPEGFRGYPSVLYVDSTGKKHTLYLVNEDETVKTVQDVLDWRDGIEAAYLPPTLEAAISSAISQCEKSTQEYIYSAYTIEKQTNIVRHEAGRSAAPPPDLATMYTHENYLAMCGFIDTARTVCDLGRQAFAVCGSTEDIQAVAALLASARECASLDGLAPVMAQLETFIAEHTGA